MTNRQSGLQIQAAYLRTKKENRPAFSIDRTWAMANDPRTWAIGAALTMSRLKQGVSTSITWADVRNLFEYKGRRAVLEANLLDQYVAGSPARREWVRSWVPHWKSLTERNASPPKQEPASAKTAPRSKKAKRQGYAPVSVPAFMSAAPPVSTPSPFACLAAG